jgi:hypothetical protein
LLAARSLPSAHLCAGLPVAGASSPKTMARTHMSDTVFALAWCLFAATCVGQPQKMWPVGAVDPSVTKALHLAVEAHVRELQPQARATEERAARLPAYHKEKMTGAHPLTYDAGKLREVVKRSLGPQTSDERERRAEEQQTHSRSAAAQLKSYAFTGSGACSTSLRSYRCRSANA